jgi:dihydroorotase
MEILLMGGHVIYPGYIDGIHDVLIKEGKIAEITPSQAETPSPDHRKNQSNSHRRIIDVRGCIVSPGLIDMHVHFREPGQEHKETIKSGSKAAAYGGFTAVCTMPNTRPVNDSSEVTTLILQKAAQAAKVKVYPCAAISYSLEGQSMSDFGRLKSAGAVAFSDDGMPVAGSLLMRQALESAKEYGLPIISHCEDLELSLGGCMNEGDVAHELGLKGIPNASESIMVMRDIALCNLTGAPLHIAHVSTKEAVDAIRAAKKSGIPLTAETAPHYFTLTQEAVREYGTNAKMNPPLRTRLDREAIREGLADGTIDAIATDHAPHHPSEKESPFAEAPNGIIGLETAVSLGLELVRKGFLAIDDLIRKMSLNPAKILGIPNGLDIGKPADITIIDTKKVFTVHATEFQSQSRNTPFDGWKLKGKPVLTILDGNVVFEETN